jgi:hypothetical protein
MKKPTSKPFYGICGSAVPGLLGTTAQAAIIEKADNATTVDLTGSWSGETAPDSGKRKITSRSSTVTSANTASVGRINTTYGWTSIVSLTAAVTGNGAYSLTLGAAGIKLASRNGINMPSIVPQEFH